MDRASSIYARIALAGRSSERLLAVRETLGSAARDWPLVVADSSEPSTLQAMAARTQVVVTTVGPYARHGLPVVAACAEAGTDYADLTGELVATASQLEIPGSTDEQIRAAVAADLNAYFTDLDDYQKRMHTANVLRAARNMRAQ